MRVPLVAGLALTILTAGCGQQPGTGSDSTAGPTEPVASTAAGAPPAGWRWESFMDVELAVPDSWAYGIAGSPWCLNQKGAGPYVGRPGPIRDVGCAGMDQQPAQDPGYRLATGGTFVWFTPLSPDKPSPAPSAVNADRLTLNRGDVRVEIQAPARLRQKIAATVRTITADQNGCPVTHPISRDPAWRPASGADVGPLAVQAVSACRYSILGPSGPHRAPGAATLISSLRLTGHAAGAAVTKLDTAQGSGPNAPKTCSTDWAYGDEVIILRLAGREGTAPREVVLRYSGCDHHGLDDGDTVRRLTAGSVAPFITGPNQVNSFSGELGAVLRPGDPAVDKGDPDAAVSSP